MSLQQSFKILDLNQNTRPSMQEIKSKYYGLSKRYHPDTFNKAQEDISIQEANQKFQQINEAFSNIKHDFQLNPQNYYVRPKSNNKFDEKQYYMSKSKEDIFKKVFGKSMQDDPMALYRSENQHLRRKYEQELNKWEMYRNQQKKQSPHYQNYEDIRQNHFYNNDTNYQYQRYQNHQNYSYSSTSYQQSTDNNSGFLKVLTVLGLICISIPTINRFRNQVSQQQNFDDKQIQGWRKKFLDNQKRVKEEKEQKRVEKINRIYEQRRQDWFPVKVRKIKNHTPKSQNLEQLDLDTNEGIKDYIFSRKISDLPKHYLDSLPKKGTYEYHQKCSQMQFQHKQVAMIMYHLKVQENPKTKMWIQQRFRICPGY